MSHASKRRQAWLLAYCLRLRGIGTGSILQYLWRAYGGVLSNAELDAIVGETAGARSEVEA